MSRHSLTIPVLAAVLALSGGLASMAAHQAAPQSTPAPASAAQSAPASALPGVRNFTRVDATIACGGAITPESFAAIKSAGFASVVNLRDASEEGANVDGEAKAAKDAGLTYFHLPFVTKTPDSKMVDAFLDAVAKPENQPMLLHCTSGGRASIFWAIKRVMVDGWTVDKAMAELPDLAKNASQPLKTFALDYLKAHGKG